MDGYNLEPGEFVILQEPSATLFDGSSEEPLDEVVLTNRCLILVNTTSQGLFKRARYLKRCPLKELSTFDDSPQIMVVKYRNDYRLQVVFRDEAVTLRFPANPKRTAERWEEAVRNVVLGNYADVRADDYLPPEITNFVDGAKGAFGALFVGGKKANPNTQQGQKRQAQITIRCMGCHAPLTGRSGAAVTCPYCDTKQTL